MKGRGRLGQQGKWEVGTCGMPCREGCGRGPDGVKDWQGQEGQRYRQAGRAKEAGGAWEQGKCWLVCVCVCG